MAKDQQSEAIIIPPSTNFEGPEKFLEIDFKPLNPDLDLVQDRTLSPIEGFRGFRSVEHEEWDKLLVHAACTILDSRSNGFFDAYLLSESSLFVYPVKIILKTCGTTTLLRVLPIIVELGKRFNLVPEWLGYSRKDFLYPQEQIYPHQSFRDEVKFLQKYFPEGEGFVMGPITGDHWYVFTAEPKLDRCLADSADRNLDMMMFGIDPEVAKLFYKNDLTPSEVTKKSGIASLMKDAIINDYLFEPCGYSLNALLGETHFTIHVTPEPICSFVSFATNAKVVEYGSLMKNVLNVFKPKRFTATLFADVGAEGHIIGADNSLEDPFRSGYVFDLGDRQFVLASATKTSFISEYSCIMCNYVCMSLNSPRNAHEVHMQRGYNDEKIEYNMQNFEAI